MILVRSNAITIKIWAIILSTLENLIKLVSVLAISASVTEASKERKVILAKVSYIYYPLCFQKDINEM